MFLSAIGGVSESEPTAGATAVLLLRAPDSKTARLVLPRNFHLCHVQYCLELSSSSLLCISLFLLFRSIEAKHLPIHGSYKLTDFTNMQPAAGYTANNLTNRLPKLNIYMYYLI